MNITKLEMDIYCQRATDKFKKEISDLNKKDQEMILMTISLFTSFLLKEIFSNKQNENDV